VQTNKIFRYTKIKISLVVYTIVFKEKVARRLGIGTTDHRHRQFLGRRQVCDGFAFSDEAAAQRETLSGLFENGVCITGLSLGGRTASGGQRMREIDEGDVESLAGQRAQAPRGHVGAALRL